MSSTIDEKVVELRFDNKQFESGVKESLGTLSKLKAAVDSKISSKSLDEVTKTAKNMDFSGAIKGIEYLTDRFSTFGIVGMRVIENITDGLMGGLTKAISSVTNSIVSGGIRRAMNIENAHFQLQGLIDDEKEVQAIMADAMDSVDGTAYAYDEAAKAASMFAASGLRSGEQMQRSLRAIAGVAATTNAEYSDMANIFTKIAGSNKVMTEELNQFAARGMNAAAAVTKYMNNVNDGTIEASESVAEYIKTITGGAQITEAEFREMVTKSKISFELFSEAMATTFGDHAKDANKTFTGSMANIRAALARTGAMFVSPLVKQDGPFVQFFNAIRIKVNEFNKALGATNGIAKKFTTWVNGMITSLTKVVEGFTVANTYVKKFGDGSELVYESATKKLQIWGDKSETIVNGEFYTPFHAFQSLVYSVVNVFKGFGTVIKPVADAFKEVFSFDVKNLYRGIETFREFTETLRLSEENSERLKNSFKGLFSITKSVISALYNAIANSKNLINIFKDIKDSIFYAIDAFGKLTLQISKAIDGSKLLDNAFGTITSTVALLTKVISSGIKVITSFGSADFKPIEAISEAFKSVQDAIDNITGSSGFSKIADAFKTVKSAISDFLKTIDPFELITNILNGGLIISITNLINSFSKTLMGIRTNVDYVRDLITNTFNLGEDFYKAAKSISLGIRSITGVMLRMQDSIRADIVFKISLSVISLAIAMSMLSKVDADAAIKSITAVSILLNELLGAFAVITTLTSAGSTQNGGGFIGVISSIFGTSSQISSAANTLIKMSLSIMILAIAMEKIADLNFEDTVKGMMAVMTLLAELTGIILIFEVTGGNKKLNEVGLGLILIAAAINVMAMAVKSLGSVETDDLIKGLLGIHTILAELAAFSIIVGDREKILSISTGMVLLSASLLLMTKAVKELGAMDVYSLINGIVAIGALLLELGLFITIVGGKERIIGISAGMIILAASINMLVIPFKEFSKLSISQIVKGLLAIGVSLMELSLALRLLPSPAKIILASTGILMLSGALVVISVALKMLGSLRIDQVVTGLIAFGGALLGIVVAMRLLPNPAKVILASAGLLILSFALKNIADVMLTLSEINGDKLVNSIIALASAMGILVLSLKLIGSHILGAASMMILALALNMIIPVFIEIGNMNISAIIKAAIGLGAALLEIVLALNLLSNPLVLVGAAALLVTSIALIPLMAVFSILGEMSIGQIVKACAGLLAAIGSITLAMNLLSISAPTILIGAGVLVGFVASMTLVAIMLGYSIGKISEGLSKISSVIKEFSSIDSKTFENVIKMLGILLVSFGLSLRSFGITSPIGAAALFIVAEALSILVPAIESFSKLNPESLPGVFDALSDAFSKFGKSLKSFGILSGIGADAVKKIAEAISILAPSMGLFMDLDPEKMSSSFDAIGKAIKNFGKELNSFGITSPIGASSFLIISEAIDRLAPAMAKMIDLDQDKLSSSLTSLGSAFKSFGEAISATPFWGSTSRAEGIGALIDAIPKLTEVIPGFMALDSVTVYTALNILGDAFKTFGDALMSTPFWGSSDRAEGIGALIDAIPKLTSALPGFMEINSTQISSTMNTLGESFKTLGEALQSAPAIGAASRGEGVATLVNSISTLTDGISKFMKDLNGKDVESTMKTLGDAFTSFGTALQSAPFWNPEGRAEGINALVGSIETLVPSVALLAALDPTAIETVLNTLGAAFVNFGESIKATPFFGTENRTQGVISVVNSIDTIVDALLRAHEKLAVSTMEAMLQSMARAIVSLGEAVNGFNVDTSAKAEAIENIVSALSKMTELNSESLTNVITALDNLPEVLTKFTTINSDALINFATAFAEFSDSCIKAFTDEFISAESNSLIITNINTFINNIITKLKEHDIDFLNAGKNHLTNYNNGLRDAHLQNTIYNSGVIAALKGYGGAISKVDRFIEAGRQCIRGFINGLQDSGLLAQVSAAATAMAQRASDAAFAALDVNSPSRVFRSLGHSTGEGLVLGIQDWYSNVYKSGEGLANQATNGMSKAVDLINSQLENIEDLNPVITPMVDLTKVTAAASSINSMFTSALSSTSSRASTAGLAIASGRSTNSLEEIQNGQNSAGGNTYNFIQNNNSPKTLSRIDIYRQTRSQFAQFREAVEGV